MHGVGTAPPLTKDFPQMSQPVVRTREDDREMFLVLSVIGAAAVVASIISIDDDTRRRKAANKDRSYWFPPTKEQLP